MILEREAETSCQAGWTAISPLIIDTRKSMTGYLMVLNGGPISWKASRQGGVTLSSSEAEFVAASQAGQEVLYLRALLKGFAYLQHGPTEIWEDNASCILMSENPTNCERSRGRTRTFLTRHGARWIRETHQMRRYTKRR